MQDRGQRRVGMGELRREISAYLMCVCCPRRTDTPQTLAKAALPLLDNVPSGRRPERTLVWHALCQSMEMPLRTDMKRRAIRKSKPVRVKRGNASAKPPRMRRAITKPPSDLADAVIDGAARALGLTIDPAWREGVAFHLLLVLSHATRVDAFELPDDTEPAPVFHA